MNEQVEECIQNTTLVSKNGSDEKVDFQDGECADDKAHIKLEEIKRYEMLTTLDNVKTKMPLSEGQSNIIYDNVKTQKGITGDGVKIEFGDGYVEKSIENTILSLETGFNKKEDFPDDEILCESTIITENAHVKLEISKQYETLTTLNDIKTETPLSEGQSNIINNSVKIEEGTTADDIRIEFDNGLLLCDHCHVYCRDYCTKCGMLMHILNKNAPDKTDNATRDGLPDDVLEIREPFGQFAIFALRDIPKDVKFGPFTGLGASESIWKLKEGKFVVSEDKLKCLSWMQHINPARSSCEGNLLPLQRDGNLYYRSTREIHEGEELLVYFGKEYEESTNKNVEMNFIPTAEEDVIDVFACTFCCLGFSSRSYLMKHKTICRNNADGKFSIEELMQCPFCNFYMGEQEYYEYHMTNCSERNVRKFSLLKPDNQTIEVRTGKTRRLQMYKCNHCKYKTSFKSDLKSHANQHYEVKMYKCEICSKRFKTKNYLKVHVENIHISNKGRQTRKYVKSDGSERKRTKKTHNCETCNYKTNKKSRLQGHIKAKHLKEYDYNCELCDFKTSRRLHLESHKKATHLKKFDYNCEMCDYKTNVRADLERHTKNKHLKQFDYNCKICDYKTNVRSDLEKHRKSKHLKQFDYNCKLCDFETNNSSDLKKHIKTQHLKEFDYNCKICNYKTNNKSYLEKHMKTRHLKEFDYNCEICDFKTNWRSYLEMHVKAQHLKKFDYNCDLCNFETNQKSYLEKHMKTKHLKEFDYNCEICDYKTNLRSNLEKHIKVRHLTEFDCNCERCDFRTNKESHLQKHMKVKHPTSQ